MSPPIRNVLVTGANGNLGSKLIAALLLAPWCERIVGLDRDFAPDRLPDDPRLIRLQADLTDRDGAWREALGNTDAIVHLAARHPYPEASWADGAVSIDMTLILIAAAAAKGVRRFVFASSNHVMGGYKDTPFARASGSITPTLDPWPGTRSVVDGVVSDRPAYAVAKLAGERALAVTARAAGLTAVSLRIGWCQPGVNHPATITAAGTPLASGAVDPALAHDLRWFRQMWLSNADFCGLVEAALQADATAWPSPAIVVNAMSGNRSAPWDLGPTEACLGYRPVDDVWTALGLPPPSDA